MSQLQRDPSIEGYKSNEGHEMIALQDLLISSNLYINFIQLLSILIIHNINFNCTNVSHCCTRFIISLLETPTMRLESSAHCLPWEPRLPIEVFSLQKDIKDFWRPFQSETRQYDISKSDFWRTSPSEFGQHDSGNRSEKLWIFQHFFNHGFVKHDSIVFQVTSTRVEKESRGKLHQITIGQCRCCWAIFLVHPVAAGNHRKI